MGVVYAIAFTIKSTEDIDIEILLLRFRQQAFERGGRFGKVGPVHHVAVAPLADFGEQVAAHEVERRQSSLSGRVMGTRLRGRECLDDGCLKSKASLYFRRSLSSLVPTLIATSHSSPWLKWRWYWISCERRDGFKTGCETILAFTYRSASVTVEILSGLNFRRLDRRCRPTAGAAVAGKTTSLCRCGRTAKPRRSGRRASRAERWADSAAAPPVPEFAYALTRSAPGLRGTRHLPSGAGDRP
jgi:hypothetical protein